MSDRNRAPIVRFENDAAAQHLAKALAEMVIAASHFQAKRQTGPETKADWIADHIYTLIQQAK